MQHPLLNIAIKAARAASKIILRNITHLDKVTVNKKGLNDFVTDVDKLAEDEIIKTIREAYPEHAIISEESGAFDGNDYVWIIDPLDGTINFIHGIPCFAISIAVQHKGILQHGVIYDPLNGELFSASRGRGAHLNARRIRVSKSEKLQGSLLGMGFPYRNQELIKLQMEALTNIFPYISGFRAIGSAALALAYVAAGRLDGIWLCCLSDWDIAAGRLLVKEAGGMTGDFKGGEDFTLGNIVAGNPKIFKNILQKITPIADKYL